MSGKLSIEARPDSVLNAYDGIIKAVDGVSSVLPDGSTFTIAFTNLETSNQDSEFADIAEHGGPGGGMFGSLIYDSDKVQPVPGPFPSSVYSRDNFIYRNFDFSVIGSGNNFWYANDMAHGISGEARKGVGAFYFFDPVPPVTRGVALETVLCTESEVKGIQFWDYLSTFWKYLTNNSRDMFESFWLGMYMVGKSLVKQANRFEETMAPENSRICVLDDYYEIQVGPLHSKPLSIDPTDPNANYIITPLGYVLDEPEYDDNGKRIYHDIVEIAASDYYKIRGIDPVYVVIKVKNSDISDKWFKIGKTIKDGITYPHIKSSEEEKYIDYLNLNPRYCSPISEADPSANPPVQFIGRYIIQLENADLSYINNNAFTIYFTTGRAYDIDKYVLDIPELQNFIQSDNGTKLYKNINYTIYNHILEFNQDIFEIKFAKPDDEIYCRLVPIIEYNLFNIYGTLVDIPDWTKYNYNNISGKSAINALLMSIQDVNDRINYELAMNIYYGIPVIPEDCQIIGLYESYGYRIIEKNNNTVTIDTYNDSELSRFIFAQGHMLCEGKDELGISSVDHLSRKITFYDASQLSVGDIVYIKLRNRMKIQTVTSSYFIVECESDEAIKHIKEMVQQMTPKGKIYPELIIYGAKGSVIVDEEIIQYNFDGIYHITDVSMAVSNNDVSAIKISIYKPDADLEDPLYNDFVNMPENLTSIDINGGYAHVPWPTHKFLYLYLKTSNNYFKMYLDSPIDTVYDTEDHLKKYDRVSRNVSVLNSSHFPGWNEFRSFKKQTGLDKDVNILELTNIIPYAEFGEYFPTDIVYLE